MAHAQAFRFRQLCSGFHSWRRQPRLGQRPVSFRIRGAYVAASTGAAPPAADHGIRTGQQVFHTKFGEGTVLAMAGSGDDARAQVNFPRHGVKWLALAIAKLQVVDG